MTFKYRKKPVVIEAFQVFKNTGPETTAYPQWLLKACGDGTIIIEDEQSYVRTLEGKLHISDGDYIIRGVQGELYPCKPDIFEATYEKVEE